MTVSFRAFIGISALMIFTGSTMAQELWYEDNNMAVGAGMAPDFKEQFENPDTWNQARKHIDV